MLTNTFSHSPLNLYAGNVFMHWNESYWHKKIKALKIRPNTVLTNIWFASSQTLIPHHTWCANNTVFLLGSIALFLACMLCNQLSQFWKLNEHILLGFNDEIWITKKQAKAVWSQLIRSYCWFKNSVFIICKLIFFSMQENIFK